MPPRLSGRLSQRAEPPPRAGCTDRTSYVTYSKHPPPPALVFLVQYACMHVCALCSSSTSAARATGAGDEPLGFLFSWFRAWVTRMLPTTQRDSPGQLGYEEVPAYIRQRQQKLAACSRAPPPAPPPPFHDALCTETASRVPPRSSIMGRHTDPAGLKDFPARHVASRVQQQRAAAITADRFS